MAIAYQEQALPVDRGIVVQSFSCVVLYQYILIDVVSGDSISSICFVPGRFENMRPLIAAE